MWANEAAGPDLEAGVLSESLYEVYGTGAGGPRSEASLVLGLSFDDYKAHPAINNSRLADMARSAAHFEYARENPRALDTPSLRFGTLAHCGVLEEESIFERYERIPPYELKIEAKNPRATKQYKEQVAAFREAIAPKIAVPIDEFDRMLGVARSVAKHAPVFHGGHSEVVIFWTDPKTGVQCKARPDYLVTDTGGPGCAHIYDFKTCRDCRDFGRSIVNYAYDRQAAFYVAGCRALGYPVSSFSFVVAETEPPYGVMHAPLSVEAMNDGHATVDELLAKIAACEASGSYPGYESPAVFQKPSWARKKRSTTLTVGDTEIEL